MLTTCISLKLEGPVDKKVNISQTYSKEDKPQVSIMDVNKGRYIEVEWRLAGWLPPNVEAELISLEFEEKKVVLARREPG